MPFGPAARISARRPRPRPVWPKRQLAVDRIGDAVGAEDLLEQRRVAPRVAEHDSDVAGRDAVAQQLEHRGGRQLRLGALAAGGVERDGGAGVDQSGRLTSNRCRSRWWSAGARLVRVVVVERRQLEPSAPRASSSWWRPATALKASRPRSKGSETVTSALHPSARRIRRASSWRVEVVEAVDEHRRPAPGGLGPPRSGGVPPSAAARRRRRAPGRAGPPPRGCRDSRGRAPRPPPRSARRGPSPAQSRSARVKRAALIELRVPAPRRSARRLARSLAAPQTRRARRASRLRTASSTRSSRWKSEAALTSKPARRRSPRTAT